MAVGARAADLDGVERGAGVGRVERPLDRTSRSEIAESSSARWVSDLSDGTRTVPRSAGTGATRTTAMGGRLAPA